MNKHKTAVITIDGPAASGKGTISALLAKKLGFHLLPSGNLYRWLTWLAQQKGMSDVEENELLALLASEPADSFLHLTAEEQKALQSDAISRATSKIAVLPRIRQALLATQRACCKPPGLVAEGRDMGTVVFPEATLKIYLTASPLCRAKRRFAQLKQQGIFVTLPEVVRSVEERDQCDTSRVVAPLKMAEDAVEVDATDKSVEETLEVVLRLATEALSAK